MIPIVFAENKKKLVFVYILFTRLVLLLFFCFSKSVNNQLSRFGFLLCFGSLSWLDIFQKETLEKFTIYCRSELDLLDEKQTEKRESKVSCQLE